MLECILFDDDDLTITSSQNIKGKNKQPLIEDDDTNSKWTDSAIKLLLAYLSENFSNYRKNKEKFMQEQPCI